MGNKNQEFGSSTDTYENMEPDEGAHQEKKWASNPPIRNVIHQTA